MMEIKSVIVLLFCVVPVIYTLEKGDPHACEMKLDDVESYIETYICKHSKHRKCTRKSRRKVARTAYICCPGWKFSEGICVPKATCAQPCVNAVCAENGECSCNTGLEHLNSTHCAPPCLPDQYNDLSDPNFTCKPKCSEPCNNGICIDINRCACNPGYKEKDQFNCEPKCGTCEHGICDAPDYECNCMSGYEKSKEGKCEPVCKDCENGKCVAPNDCECHTGYTNEEEKCNPICVHTCVNSTCIAPDVCRCNEGFETAGNNWTCRPSCKSCENGLCIAPNRCACNDGYKENEEGICMPVCKPPCTDGVCTKPDTCVCNSGYKMDGDAKICKPTCSPSCVNATCIGVDDCKCFDRYEKTNVSNVCKPSCNSCNNGDCTDPDVCQCHDGYELVNGTCLLAPSINCKDCDGICKDGVCACSNSSLCYLIESADVESTPTLAGLQLTWMLGGAVGLLLVVIVTVVMVRMWRQRQSYDQKTPDDENAYGSVVYTVPNTLVHREPLEPDYDDVELARETDVALLDHIPTENYVERI